jgi:hypothetical protein
MEFAEDVMLGTGHLDKIAQWRAARQGDQMAATGTVETHFRCLKCGAPHVAVIDGAGWHLHLGVEVEV